MSLAPWLPPLFGLINTSRGLLWRWENGFTWAMVEEGGEEVAEEGKGRREGRRGWKEGRGEEGRMRGGDKGK